MLLSNRGLFDYDVSVLMLLKIMLEMNLLTLYMTVYVADVTIGRQAYCLLMLL